MPTFKRGNMFDRKCDVLLVTANSYLRKDGCLVMGRGAAAELSSRRADMPAIFGALVRWQCGHLGKYGVLLTTPRRSDYFQLVGIFQVKEDFRDDAELSLIEHSVRCLCSKDAVAKGEKVSLNFPGIGNGKLSRKEVLPLLEPLPKNVTIWELP